jgi:hypothetical protein
VREKREESRIYKEGTDFISACSFSMAFKTSLRALPDVSAFRVHCGVILKCILIKDRLCTVLVSNPILGCWIDTCMELRP